MAANDLPFSEFLSGFFPDLLKAFDTSTLTDLDLQYGDVRLTLRRLVTVIGADSAVIPATGTSAAGMPAEQPEGHVITAQMVGTFYLTSSPGKPPLVQEGDVIEKGQVIGIIEAMKVMNELEADLGGRIIRILVKNQEPVEYGQPLMLVAPE